MLFNNGNFIQSSIQPTKRTEDLGGQRSLNIGVRRIENIRIERENQAFAKRLFDRVGSLSKKKMDEEFHNHKQYMKQI